MDIGEPEHPHPAVPLTPKDLGFFRRPEWEWAKDSWWYDGPNGGLLLLWWSKPDQQWFVHYLTTTATCSTWNGPGLDELRAWLASIILMGIV